MTALRWLQMFLAVMLSRLVGWLSRLAGHGGSSLPGLIARRLDPDVLTRLGARLSGGVALITGTNGKTTTAALAAAALEEGGVRVVRNPSGANLILGLTTALAGDVDCLLRPKSGLALLETDEATMPRAGEELAPRLVAVTNFFRDQLDRYGELSTTVDLVSRGLERLRPGGRAVLNADDPQAAALAAKAPDVWFYGLDYGHEVDTDEPPGDARFCPRCRQELRYTQRYYAHLGHYRCPACGFQRPDPRVRVEAVTGSGDQRELQLATPAGPLAVPLQLPGTYNVYNAVLAVTIALALGTAPEAVAAGLARGRAAFGRMEAVVWRGREIRLALVKNPTGFNQVLRTLAEDARAKDVLVAINDRYADGRDVSWLWDVDFEGVAARIGAESWWVSGTRALDMAIRLKYAGVASDRITVGDGDPGACLEQVVEQTERPLYVLPTYTAMLELRERLTQRGVVRHFREG
jgi:UDP-N-acetylmuramyl tripeptide synthase